MNDLFWWAETFVLMYGGAILVALAVLLGIGALVFHIRAAWLLWTAGACGLAGLVLLALLVLSFRGLSNL